MDLLYQRYADPLPLLEKMVAAGRLTWFVTNLLDAVDKEKYENEIWELYLHKVFDNRSFADFKRDTMNKARSAISHKTLENNPKAVVNTVNKSYKIMEMMNKQTSH